MSSLNEAQVIGYLGGDPDVRYTQNNTCVANFSVATTEKYKDQRGNPQEDTQWHRIVAFGKIAEVIREYVKKGSRIYAKGKLQTEEWTDREGIKRYTTKIIMRDLVMLGDSRNSSANGNGAGSRAPQPAAQPAGNSADGSEPFDTDSDDMPF